MDTFLNKKKDSPALPQAGFPGKAPKTGAKPPSTLLFNPQPRPRFVFPQVCSSDKNGPPPGGGGASGYWQLRTSKLSEQAPGKVSQLFHGLSFYFNGRSGDKQTMHLKGAVSKYGGRTTPFMSMKGVTHVIAENLSAVKTHKAMKSLKMKVVHPDWLTRCIEEGKLLPDAPFRVVRSQKLGMDNFLRSSSSTMMSMPSSSPYGRDDGRCRSAQKENEIIETPRRHHSSLGRPSVVSGASGDGRHEGKRTESGDRRGGAGGKGGREGGDAASVAGAAVAKSNNRLEDSRRRRRNGALSEGTVSRRDNSTVSCKRKAAVSIQDSNHAGRNAVRAQGSCESDTRMHRPRHNSNIRPRKRCRDAGEVLPSSRTITTSSAPNQGGDTRMYDCAEENRITDAD